VIAHVIVAVALPDAAVASVQGFDEMVPVGLRPLTVTLAKAGGVWLVPSYSLKT
jgi:hypothetical protein